MFFINNSLTSQNKPRFKFGDSNQLLSITHQIYKPFDGGHEVWSVFLVKAFDKVWHNGLIFKLKQNRISGSLWNIVKQRVVLNGQLSSWPDIESGVPQRSIFGPFLFLIYINNLSGSLTEQM